MDWASSQLKPLISHLQAEQGWVFYICWYLKSIIASTSVTGIYRDICEISPRTSLRLVFDIRIHTLLVQWFLWQRAAASSSISCSFCRQGVKGWKNCIVAVNQPGTASLRFFTKLVKGKPSYKKELRAHLQGSKCWISCAKLCNCLILVCDWFILFGLLLFCHVMWCFYWLADIGPSQIYQYRHLVNQYGWYKNCF